MVLFIISFVSPDDAAYHIVTDDVFIAEIDHADTADVFEYLFGFGQARHAPVDEVDLRGVAVDDDPRVVAHTGEEHLHLFPRRVLGFIEDDERLFQSPAAHVSERRDFDDVAVDHLLELVVAEHIGQGIVQGAQVGIDLFL